MIVRAIDRDPRGRPASAPQFASALPGGDPLAAALAAGETPSPEMVAASGIKEGIRPALAWSLLAVVIFGSFAAVLMNRRIMLPELLPPGRPPDILAERARQLIVKMGYPEPPVDELVSIGIVGNFLDYAQQQAKDDDRLRILRSFNPITFRYVRSLRPILLIDIQVLPFRLRREPPEVSGDIDMTLRHDGRLLQFEVIPPRVVPPPNSTPAPAPPDWAMLFSEAGFDIATWKPAAPQWNPRMHSDERVAWLGALPEYPDVPLRIEGASYRGNPVRFVVIGPWTTPAGVVTGREPPLGQKILFAFTFAGLAAVMGGGVFFAHRNLRLGRGDRRGATRLAIFAFVLLTLRWAFSAHHLASPNEVGLFVIALSTHVYTAMLIWVVYLALEPLVRRRWPQVLVSWTRLLSGEWRDPLVGRDILIGCAAGVVEECIRRMAFLSTSWDGYRALPVLQQDLGALADSSSFLAWLLAPEAFYIPLFILFLFFFLSVLLRSEWFVAAIFAAVAAMAGLSSGAPWISVVITVMSIPAALLLLRRVGFTAMTFAAFVGWRLATIPITFETSAWYARGGYAALAVILALTLYGFRTALGSRPLLDLSRVEN